MRDETRRAWGVPCAPGASPRRQRLSGAAYDLIAADMVDMETYALWPACQKFALPLIVLRGISDGTAEGAKFADWTEYLHIIDEKLATIVDRILAGEVVG